jgi:hypothetical protein
MKKKRQKLIAVQVAAATGAAGATGSTGFGSIVPLEGGTLEELLAAWRVVQIQPLGPLPAEGGGEGHYLALLLLEEAAADETQGRLGFGVP